MSKIIASTLIAGGLVLSAPASARDVSVEVTNITNASYFTPLLVAAHAEGVHLFRLGEEASAHLQAMAEGGAIGGLAADVVAAGGIHVSDPAGGVLAPGASATAELDVKGKKEAFLSIVAMILPTNDGFVGLDSLRIPKKKGTYTFFLRGYDAGTEENDELVVGMEGGAPGVPGIPADPGHNAGTGGTGAVDFAEENHTVHVHRGILGDTDLSAGLSDLDSRVHRWQNPVARVVVTVGR